ncbi:hypothetical protein D9615_002708 [Tricholomella constricta]|uniref:UBC core domain-containing protein n=1 Tax=Tricholomella constricta TaxID=117010 RepID=A0A8H5HFW6_9AGAR|nr:hypothetical protein D9615_002708 [Tricholomella constricta]
MPLPRTLLSRLQHDLAELLESPYPGVTVFIDDANIQKLCLVLTPPSGPWKDLALHFDVELPNHWPSSPPMIYSSIAGIKHPNLSGNWICCDLLKEQDELEIGYTGGVDFARSVSSISYVLLEYEGDMSQVEQFDGRVVDIGDYLLVRYELDTSQATSQDQLERLWKTTSMPSSVAVVGDCDGEMSRHKSKDVRIPLRRIETINPRWHSTFKLISKWQCKRCPYGSPAFPVQRIAAEAHRDVAPSPLPDCSPSCLLKILNDDVLLELARYLLSESLVSFSVAYPRFRRLVTSTHILLERELRCFFLRNPLRTSILGIGIAFDPNSRKLSSDFDWLSKEAFDTYNVRISIQKRDFQYFLPLAFNRLHFERVEQHIWAHLATLDSDVRDAEKQVNRRYRWKPSRRTAPPEQPHQTVGVVFKLMNNTVVALMQACDDVLEKTLGNQISTVTLLHASERAVTAYGHLFHLLLCLSRTKPLILQEAFDRLLDFIRLPASRVKSEVPDLGELIILITLVLAHPPPGDFTIKWTTINGPFLEEAIVRNVRWILKAQPTLEAMETGPSDYRLHHTFMESKTSLRLIMFQMAFLDIFVKTYASRLSRLDDNYGFPEPDIPARMVEEVKAIYKVDTWQGFFHRVQYARGYTLSKEAFSRMLRKAVHTSAQRKYHIPKKPQEMHLLWREREILERKWAKGRS